jgi:hypothetical protein
VGSFALSDFRFLPDENDAGLSQCRAGILMAAGVWLHLTERHEHEHFHGAVGHTHPHVH